VAARISGARTAKALARGNARPQGLKPASSLTLDAALKRRSSTLLHAMLVRVFDIFGDTDLSEALGNMNLHLIDGVVEVAAGIPQCGCWLGAALAVSGSRLDRVVACLASFPVISP